MISERDIWTSANLLITQRGEDAAIVAAQRADEMLAAGDVDGLAVWKRIMKACFAMMQAEGTIN